MLIHELTPDECRDAIRRTNLGRLACVNGDEPYIVPIYFDFDGEDLYSFATLGQKIEWMRQNPKVCVEIDEIIDQFHWTTVVVFGRYEELTTTPEHEVVRRRAQELFQKRPEWWLPGAAKAQSDEHSIPIVFRIRIRRVSGRRAQRSRMKPADLEARATQAQPPRWWRDVLAPVHKPIKPR